MMHGTNATVIDWTAILPTASVRLIGAGMRLTACCIGVVIRYFYLERCDFKSLLGQSTAQDRQAF